MVWEKEKIIEFMSDERMGFYLGGSRRMNQLYPDVVRITDNTDYDFYCAGTPAQYDALSSMGFEIVNAKDRSYWDNLLVDIWINKRYGIECLIRSDVGLYKRVFDSININDYALRLWKSNPDHPVGDMCAFRAGCLAWFNYMFHAANPDNLPF